MALIFSLLRASHARGTHHYLALDALDDLAASPAWRRLMYKHIAMYLEGAKAPDVAFKDFQNHVLHPRDGFWGGAPAQAETWFKECVAALTKRDWPAAAYAAGVLTHYCSDPCMPLHTHQTTAESNIHAAVEWSVSTSYAKLSALGQSAMSGSVPTVGTEPGWLENLLRGAATEATTHYETLLTHYDFKRGVVAPEEGLDLVGQRAVATMLRYARQLLTLVLDRALAEANVTPDEVSLAGDALAAFVTLPMARRRKHLEQATDRQLIEAMYDELMETGRVKKTLREDERQIQTLYQSEVLDARSFTAAPLEKTATGHRESAVAATEKPAASTTSSKAKAGAASTSLAKNTSSLASYRPTAHDSKTGRLSPDAAIVDAPSIGPKTAARLNAVGIDTVGDFLKAHPIALASRLDISYLTPETLTAWQEQARLMLSLSEMRGSEAQLLVGAGYRTVENIAAADPSVLCADVLHFALSDEGRSILREGHSPDLEQITALAARARELKAA